MRTSLLVLALLAVAGCTPGPRSENAGDSVAEIPEGQEGSVEQLEFYHHLHGPDRRGFGLAAGPFFPKDDEFDTGWTVGIAGEAFGVALGRYDVAYHAIASEDGQGEGGLAEFSIGLGGFLYGGIGGAFPVFERGELELESTGFGYVGLWAPLLFAPGSDLRASITGRYCWYTDEAELDGNEIDLDGWSIVTTFHLDF